MRRYTLEIRFKSRLSDWGRLTPTSKGGTRYSLLIDESAPLVKQVGTILHEFCHMIFYMIFSPVAIDEVREHRLCKKLDDVGRRGFQAYLDGK